MGRSEPQTVRVEYHPAVEAEVAEALQRYDAGVTTFGRGVQSRVAPGHRAGCGETRKVPCSEARLSSSQLEAISISLHLP